MIYYKFGYQLLEFLVFLYISDEKIEIHTLFGGLSELTPMIFNMGLTHLGLETYNQYKK